MTGEDFDLATLDGLDDLLAPVSPHESSAAVAPVQPGPPAEVVTFDGALAEVRKNTRAGAANALHSAVKVMAAAFDAGEADFDDALKAVPVLSKVVEHFEKLEAAQKDKSTDGVIFNVVIDLIGGGISVEMHPVDVIEDAVTEVVHGPGVAGEAPQAEADAAPAGYEIDFAALIVDGESA